MDTIPCGLCAPWHDKMTQRVPRKKKLLPVLLKICLYSKMERWKAFSLCQHMLLSTKAGKQALPHFLLS